MASGEIIFQKVNTNDNIADALTKRVESQNCERLIDMMSAETQACCRNVLDLQVFLYTYISFLICIYFLYVLSCVVQVRTQGWAQGRAQGRAGSGPGAAPGSGALARAQGRTQWPF